jgi:hypothetical protein
MSGEVSLVMHGASADFLLLALYSGNQTRCLLISSDQDYTIENQTANDPALRPAKVSLANVPFIELTGWRNDDLEQARRQGIVALSAQQTGAARAIFEVTGRLSPDPIPVRSPHRFVSGTQAYRSRSLSGVGICHQRLAGCREGARIESASNCSICGVSRISL